MEIGLAVKTRSSMNSKLLMLDLMQLTNLLETLVHISSLGMSTLRPSFRRGAVSEELRSGARNG